MFIRLMEVKASSPKAGLLHMDCTSVPEDEDISEDDDDDRNHKHRRRGAHSQSLEADSSEQGLTRPYRQRNKTFGNGYPFREGGSNSNESLKNYNVASQEKDFSGRFDKRRLNFPSFSRGLLDMNQRARVNQSVSADSGPAKGRGGDSVIWGQCDSRFSQLDVAAQLVQQGFVPPNLFSGRGLPTVSNFPGTSWSAFGLIPSLPGGGLDTLHSFGLPGSLRPPINPSLGMGIPLQRCRDFEESGFCLRGDMCPMEHGVNRIVIDDVQSLSKFNLPAVPVLGTTAGQGPILANASASKFTNNKDLQIKNSKREMIDGGMGLNSTSVGSSVVGVVDLYDPDQPLWTNDCPETSLAVAAVDGPDFNGIVPLMMQKDTSNQHSLALSGGPPDDIPRTSARTATASQTSSLWGKIGIAKSKLEVTSKTDSTLISPSNLENEMKKDAELIELPQGVARQEGEMNTDNVGSCFPGSSKPSSDPGHNFRRSSQKAARTIFVSGVPPKVNRREALLSHFKKFGEVIDIYIPLNSERAFVQFSKREEAEAALKAPDAVMGNRFIKLRWANHDNIPDDGNGRPGNTSDNTRVLVVALGPPSLPASAKGHDNLQAVALKGSVSNVPVTSLSTSDVIKFTINSPKVPLPSQKKLENLELLKEELRKKQEMLEQKRNEFRRQLGKLEKQATCLKDDRGSDPPSKRHKSAAEVDAPKSEISKSASDSSFLSLPQSEKITDTSRSGENAVAQTFKPVSNPALLDPHSFKPSIRSLAHLGPHFINKYKLDNRPTVFMVLPPLPTGLATVSALKEHFSCYGELWVVELDTFRQKDNSNESEVVKKYARISYTTRQSAERAFLNGKRWQGHKLQFVWVTSGNASKESAAKEHQSSLSEQSFITDIHSSGEVGATNSQISAASVILKSEDLNRQEDKKSKGDRSEILKSDQEGNSHPN